MNEKIRLVIVDDYPVVLTGLSTMLKSVEDIELVGVADNGKKAVELALSLSPNVMLMNVAMPELDGIDATRLIKENTPEVNVLIFSGLSGYDQVTAAFNAGATGYMLKEVKETELLDAIRHVARGEAWVHPLVIGHVLKQIQHPAEQIGLIKNLTEREAEVLKNMAQGYTNQEIANLMVVSSATIHSHVSHILAKLEVSSRTQAVIYALRAGFVKE